METYAEGTHWAEVRGGTAYHPREYREETKEDFLFHMEGQKLFRMCLEYTPPFMETLFKEAQVTLDQIDLVLPHQASL